MNARSTRPARSRRPSIVGELGRAIGDAALETLWPTRCAVCDAPGALLCDRCRRDLAYIDRWRACPRCGAAWGRLQCTECNPVTLSRLGLARLPFESCVCAVALDDAAHRIATLYKDAGERRLSAVMGSIMADATDPDWLREADAVTWVPASRTAFRRRGFDHAEELARAFAACAGGELGAGRPPAARLQRACAHRTSGPPLTHPQHPCAHGGGSPAAHSHHPLARVPVVALLDRPATRDQRGLSRAERVENVADRFSAIAGVRVPPRVILVDDVCTTGSTLVAATNALIAAGAERIRCVAFARAV